MVVVLFLGGLQLIGIGFLENISGGVTLRQSAGQHTSFAKFMGEMTADGP